MKILIKPEIMARLLCYATATNLEFSGFGFCERQGQDILVYDFVLLDVGSWGYTEIDPKVILPLLERPDRKQMKVWIHRHPVGNGIPGPHNWSSRDELTIQKEPLGATPESVSWSVSIVLTPLGFVGRIDNYLKGITQNLEVEPSTRDFFLELQAFATGSGKATSTRRRTKNSSSEDFPAPETSQKKGRKRTLVGIKTPLKPRKPKTPKNGKTGRMKATLTRLISIAATFTKHFASSLNIMTHRLLLWPTFAKITALIGSGKEDPATTAANPVYGGNH